jgi:hypothetical protein
MKLPDRLKKLEAAAQAEGVRITRIEVIAHGTEKGFAMVLTDTDKWEHIPLGQANHETK